MPINSFIKFFVKDSRAVGVLLIVCTSVSLLLSNTISGGVYTRIWQQEILPLTNLHLPSTLMHIINDALMSFFFFLAGMEIKNEILVGELNTLKKSMLPIASAAGGMLVPAVIYLACCHEKSTVSGWGIPIATDIAFSLAVLSLLGKQAPLSMRVFLTAIAIIDDIGGILTIAVFYPGQLNMMYLGLATLVILLLFCLYVFKTRSVYLYLVLGLPLWYFIYHSGIHATIAGVVLGLMIPPQHIHRIARKLSIPVNYLILPLFALANTAIALPGDLTSAIMSPVHRGVFLGLFLGKPLGILLATWIALKLNIGHLPGSMTLKQVAGIGIIAGIGFTVSLFITMLAFTDAASQTAARLAVINASICSGFVGYWFLRYTRRKHYG